MIYLPIPHVPSLIEPSHFTHQLAYTIHSALRTSHPNVEIYSDGSKLLLRNLPDSFGRKNARGPEHISHGLVTALETFVEETGVMVTHRAMWVPNGWTASPATRIQKANALEFRVLVPFNARSSVLPRPLA